VDGLKTGHTQSAGYCLAASAKRNGMRLISAVMGTESEKARADETQKLLNYGFRFFETHQLYKKGDPDLAVDVWKGENESVKLGLADDLYVTITMNDENKNTHQPVEGVDTSLDNDEKHGLSFPCEYPIKAMGPNTEAFADEMYTRRFSRWARPASPSIFLMPVTSRSFTWIAVARSPITAPARLWLIR